MFLFLLLLMLFIKLLQYILGRLVRYITSNMVIPMVQMMMMLLILRIPHQVLMQLLLYFILLLMLIVSYFNIFQLLLIGLILLCYPQILFGVINLIQVLFLIEIVIFITLFVDGDTQVRLAGMTLCLILVSTVLDLMGGYLLDHILSDMIQDFIL